MQKDTKLNKIVSFVIVILFLFVIFLVANKYDSHIYSVDELDQHLVGMNCDSKIPFVGKKIIIEGDADLFTVSQLKPLYDDVQQIMFSSKNNQNPSVGIIFNRLQEKNISMITNFIEGKPNLETLKIKVSGNLEIQKSYAGGLLNEDGAGGGSSCFPFFLLNIDKVIDVQIGKQTEVNYQGTLQDYFPIDGDKYNKLKEVLKKNLNNNLIGEDREIIITSSEDINGTNMVDEFLVNTGTGGSTMDLYTIVLMKNDEPVVAQIKDKNGKISYFQGMSGSGGSGRYGGDVVLIPKNQIGDDLTSGIEVDSYSIYKTKDDYCEASFYKWNPATEIFEYDQKLSDERFKSYLFGLCSSLKDLTN